MAFEKGTLYQFPLSQLTPDPDQPRKYLDPASLAELQASISSHGVLQPILVREDGAAGFIVVSGERRFQAAKLAGLATIPALVTDGEPAEISIIENLLRENIKYFESYLKLEKNPDTWVKRALNEIRDGSTIKHYGIYSCPD